MPLIKKHWLFIIAVVCILAVFFAAYRPTLFNFFLADDFGFLAWANDVAKNPQILLEKYFGSWQGWFVIKQPPPNTLVVYRPLYNTVIFLEYKLWGLNGLYCRLVNMIIELLSGLLLGFIVVAISKKRGDQSFLSNKQVKGWALLAGALFVLFPLHCESVNWMTDVVDPLVTLFGLFGLWCYMQWRTSYKRSYLCLSIIGVILALLTKEMAVVLPVMIFIYDFLIPDKIGDKAKDLKINNALLRNLYQSLIATMPYWLILIGYFVMRKILLGDFIAGYPDSMCYPTIAGWLRGLSDVFVPVNTNIIGTHSYIYRAWLIVLPVAILLSLAATVRANKDVWKIVGFFVLWFLLSLAPTYKVFPTLMSCGTGARLAYLATGPLCALLTFGVAVFSTENKFAFFVRGVALAFVGLSALIVYTNNIAWAEAGRWTSKVVDELRSYYKHIDGDPYVYVTGLPTEHVRSIYSVGILAAITRVPILDKERLHCARLDGDDLYLSPGFVKDAFAKNQKQIKLLYWDWQNNNLKRVRSFEQARDFKRNWQGHDLQNIMQVTSLRGASTPQVNCLSDGSVEIISSEKENTFIMIELNLPNLPCWYVDFLGLKTQFVNLKTFGPFGRADLLFANDIANDYSKIYRTFDYCKVPIKSTSEKQDILFPLRNIPAWTMGGKCSSVRIILPIEQKIRINGLYVPDTKSLMPNVDLQLAVDDPPGQIRLDNKQQSRHLVKYDGCDLNGSREAILEILPVSDSFDNVDLQNSSKLFLLTERCFASKGNFVISRSEFPALAGLYRARIRLLDHTGHQVGVTSDIFFISTAI